MVGKFRSVLKNKSQYCFIDGADGNTYFCHKSNMNTPQDWSYVWEGNECSFKIEKASGENKSDIAVEVIPLPVSVQKNKLKDSKAEKVTWRKYLSTNQFYVVTNKVRGSKNCFEVVLNPSGTVTLYKNKLLGEEKVYFYEAEKGDICHFRLQRCLAVKKGKSYVVKEIRFNNSLGPVLYHGDVVITL